MSRSFGFLSVLVLVLFAAPAPAQSPSTMSYQGVLTMPGGTLVPDGDYAISFRLFDVAVAGAPLWSESYATVSVKSGVFSVLLGSTTPLAITFDKPLWLGIQVGAEPEMAPRVALASSPYSMGLRLPFEGTQSSTSASFTVRNGDLASPALSVDHILDLGTTANEGFLRVMKGGGLTGAGLTLDDFGGVGGGQMLGFNGVGNPTYALQPDANGTGGYFSVRRSAIGTGFSVDGNYNNTGDPRIWFDGSTNDCVFNMNLTGDDSVVLPTGAIAKTEIADEAGIASIDESVSQSLTGGISTILTRTITVPEAGFVVAIGSFTAEMGHTSGVGSRVIGGVNMDQNLSFSSITRVPWIEANAPTGLYMIPLSVNEVFSVTAGTHTFYLLGQEVSTVGSAVDGSLTLMYFSSSYGSVSKAGALASQPGEESKRGPLSDAEISSEQAEHQRDRLDRIQRELESMRAAMPQAEDNAPRR